MNKWEYEEKLAPAEKELNEEAGPGQGGLVPQLPIEKHPDSASTPRTMSLAMAPFNKDGGDRKSVTPEMAISLITWSTRYGLDPWLGDTIYYFGKPYITELGAIRLASRVKGYRLYSVAHLERERYASYGYPEDSWVFVCHVEFQGMENSIEEHGVVTQREIDDLKAKHGDQAQYLAVVKQPWHQARARAIRRAHLIAAQITPEATE